MLILAHKRGILAVAGASVAIFWPGSLVFGFPGVMAPYWQQTFQVGSAATGYMMFFILAATGVCMYPAGRLQERLGARLMVSLGCLIASFGLFIAAYATSIGWVYLWAFVSGLASCFVYVPALTSVQRWFPTRRGLVTGIVNLFFGFSAAIMSPLFNYLLGTMGYINMCVTLAIAFIPVGLIAASFTEMPERIGVAVTPSPSPTQAPPRPEQEILPAPSLTVKESLRTRNFWFLWSTWALHGAAAVSMITLSVIFGLSKGLTPAMAVLILTAFNFTSGISRLLSGYLSDFMGRTTIMSITFFASGIAYFILPRTDAAVLLIILAAIIGYSFGTMFAVSAPLASDCFGLKHFGAIFGLVFTAYGFVASLIGPSLSGYLLDLTAGNYTLVFSYLGVFSFISAIIIRQVKPETVGQ